MMHLLLCVVATLSYLRVEELPFGGVGPSGQGAYHGKFGFDTFTHYKVGIMVLILNGNLKIGAHVDSEIGNLVCLRNLFK